MFIKRYNSINNLNNNKIHNNFFRYKKKYNNILIILLLCLGRYLYIKSLKGCDGDESKCTNNINYIIDDFYKCIYSSLIFLFSLFLIQIKLCSIYNLLIFFLILFELIIKDHGESFLNHGKLNFNKKYKFNIYI